MPPRDNTQNYTIVQKKPPRSNCRAALKYEAAVNNILNHRVCFQFESNDGIQLVGCFGGQHRPQAVFIPGRFTGRENRNFLPCLQQRGVPDLCGQTDPRW